MAYVVFLNISDRRKDSLNRWMCDAKILDVINVTERLILRSQRGRPGV